LLGKPSPVSFNPGPHTYRRGREVGHDGPILINGELAMGIFRLYTGGDGQSHIGELDLSAHPELTSPLAASTINFREWPPGHFLN